ncbi:hypothetical protein M5C99_20660 [Acidovorax sp. NCPPB 2350]|nr:hypothetical protein M5C99_20660 [Acidovorax sp. NCPPB 2350]
MSSEAQGKKYVVGHGALLEWALAAWEDTSPSLQLEPVSVGQDGDYRFDLAALAQASPADATAFVAWGPQFLNFRRLELMGELKSRGFAMPPLVCRGAQVSSSAQLGENCSIGAGAVVEPRARIGFNSHVGASVVVGAGAQIGTSAWIAAGARIGMQSKIGSNTILGDGVSIADGISIGRQCTLNLPGIQTTALADKTFLLSGFTTPVTIAEYGAQAAASS